MSYCPNYEVELVMWCRGGVPVYKREHFLSDWTYDPLKDTYSDWLTGAWRTAWPCNTWAALIDPEVVCVTNDAWVTVIKAVAVFDTSVNPPTITLYDFGWSILVWYTVTECLDKLTLVKWDAYCDGWITVIPFWLTDEWWTPSATIAFWRNALTWAVVTPSGSQTLWACGGITLASIDCLTANPNVKECNSDDILAALETIVANTTASNVNEALIITELQLIKAQTIAINANTDTIETKLDTLIADQLAWNVTLIDIKNTLINDILPELQAINANTDTVETLIASTNTKLDTLIAELDIEQYETSPLPICVTNAWVSTTWFTFERVQFNSELWTEISRTKYYKNESNLETTTAPIWAIEDWYCSILKKYEWTCGTSIPVWFDKFEVDAPITAAWPTTSLLDFYVAWIHTSWWDFNVINWNTFDNTITTLWTNISDVQAGINAAMIAWWFTASDAVYSINYATNTPIIYVNPTLWLPWNYITLLCGWTSTSWTWTQKLHFNTPTTLEWAAWSDYLKVKIVCPDTPVYTKVLDWNVMPIGWWTYTFANPVTVVTISNDTDWYVIAQFDNSLWTTWNNQIPIWAKQSYNLQANDNSLITWVTLTTSSWTSWSYLISWVRL